MEQCENEWRINAWFVDSTRVYTKIEFLSLLLFGAMIAFFGFISLTFYKKSLYSY